VLRRKLKSIVQAIVHDHYLMLPSGVAKDSAEGIAFLAKKVLELIGEPENGIYSFLHAQVSQVKNIIIIF